MDDNKEKALAAALGQIERQFGKGSVMRLGDADVGKDIQAISTGSLGLDIALGIGGLPRGVCSCATIFAAICPAGYHLYVCIRIHTHLYHICTHVFLS